MSNWHEHNPYVIAGVAVLPETKEQLQALADAAGVKLSTYMRNLALKHLEHVKQSRKTA